MGSRWLYNAFVFKRIFTLFERERERLLLFAVMSWSLASPLGLVVLDLAG